MEKIKVGLIGLGSVAQIIHLPILETLSDRYELVAICDISGQLLEAIGTRYNVARRYTDAFEMVSQTNLDAVFVLNNDEYHAECAIAALTQGKHVLIEKPVCLTLEDADAIIKARDAAGVQAMVGYMRRFAPAFTEAIKEVSQLGRINYARVRSLIGAGRLFIDETSHVLRPLDIPPEAVLDRRQRATRMLEKATDNAPRVKQNAYRHMLGLNCHDLSAMREIIGFPKRVVSAVQWNEGKFVNALFEYEEFYASFETGVDLNRRFDAHIQVYGEQKAVTIQYNTPYIRHLPTTRIVEETVNEAFRRTENRPSFKDAYTVELEYFHKVVTERIRPKTSIEDAKEDLKLIRMIVDALE